MHNVTLIAVFLLFLSFSLSFFVVRSEPDEIHAEAVLAGKRFQKWPNASDPEIVPPCYGFCSPRPTFTPCIKTVIEWDPRLNLPCDFNGHIPGPIIIGNPPAPCPHFIPAILTTQTVYATPPVVVPFPSYITKSVVALSTVSRFATTTAATSSTNSTNVDSSATALSWVGLLVAFACL